ncbi:MAG: MMPL family transporter [Deltaproteobacteria bacterium]|nr:MMPL family transporter [Deltaproteobacteria bacterium]MBW2362544.1 MMPL family transporter [Deltaproteobacteria bacterium]
MPEASGPVDPLQFAAGAALLLSAGLFLAVRWPRHVVARPRLVLAIVGVVTLAALAALVRPSPLALRLRIDPSTELLLPRGDPGVEAYRRAIVDFGDDQIFVVAMQCDDVFRSEHLMALRRVSDAVSRIEGVRGVASLVKVTAFRYDPDEDWIEVRPFIEEIPDSTEELARLRERALTTAPYRRNLISDDGRTAALNISFKPMTDREFIAAKLDAQIRTTLAAETSDQRRFYVSGRPHVKSLMYETMIRDLAVLIPAVLVVVGLVLALVAGSARGLWLPLGGVALAIVWTFGAVALLDRPLTVLTVLLAPTLIAIGSVYGVHVVNRYEEELATAGGGEAIVLRTTLEMRVPVCIAGVTTMIGFAALLISDVPAVFEIGAFSILGVASVTLLSLSAVPAALVLLPLPPEVSGRRVRLAAGCRRVLDAALRRAAHLACARSGLVIGGFGVVTLVALLAVPRIVIDTDYLSFFDADSEVRRDFDRINELLSGAVPLYIVLRGEVPGAFREPALLRAVEELERRIEALPGVGRTLSLLEGVRSLNRAIESGVPAEERIPDSREAVTELLFMVPKGDLLRFSTIDQSALNVVVRTGEVGSAAMRELTRRIDAELASGVLPASVDAEVTGHAVLLNRAADGVARSQPRTVALAALAIFVLLAAGLRSVRLGLVAMLPNVVPILIFFGTLGLGAAPLSLPTSLIGSVALGIAIDATAHYLVRYRNERRGGASAAEAALRTQLSAGRPVAIAAAMLACGFFAVAASEFATLRQFGVLTAFTMLTCAATDLLLLPAILVRWRL